MLHQTKQRNKRMVLALLVCGFVAFSSSCKKEFSAGPITTENRVLSDTVSSIYVNGSMDVFITNDPSYDVKVEAGEKLIPYITTNLINNELKIDERSNQFFRDDRVRVYVSVNYLNSITLKGSGDVNGSNLLANHTFVKLDGSGDVSLSYATLNTIDVDLKGSGDIVINGTAASSNVELRGSGDINCKDLIVADSHVDLDGSGDIKVYVTNSLTANVDGSGDVFYWGSPTTVNTNVSGSGQVTGM